MERARIYVCSGSFGPRPAARVYQDARDMCLRPPGLHAAALGHATLSRSRWRPWLKNKGTFSPFRDSRTYSRRADADSYLVYIAEADDGEDGDEDGDDEMPEVAPAPSMPVSVPPSHRPPLRLIAVGFRCACLSEEKTVTHWHPNSYSYS